MAIAVSPRSVGLMLAATVVAGWFETTTAPDVAPRVSRSQQSARPQGGRTRRGDLGVIQPVPDTTRLREWLNSPPQPERGRNPFVYGTRVPSRVAPREPEPVSVELPPPMPVEPPMPIFKLSGIATNTDAGTVTMTAIIIDNGAMVFAKAGDKLSNGYSVVEVGEMSVTLVDAAGVTLTVRLP